MDCPSNTSQQYDKPDPDDGIQFDVTVGARHGCDEKILIVAVIKRAESSFGHLGHAARRTVS